jgi:hypothetical protein
VKRDGRAIGISVDMSGIVAKLEQMNPKPKKVWTAEETRAIADRQIALHAQERRGRFTVVEGGKKDGPVE